MKLPSSLRALLLLLLLLLVSFSQGRKGGGHAAEGHSESLASSEDEANPIQNNPEYNEPEDSIDNDNESDNDDNDDDDEGADTEKPDGISVKTNIDIILRKSKKQYRKTLKYAKKNRTKITVALAIFAFRYEIRKTIVHLIKNEIMDPKTGKLRVGPTNMLKLFLFVDFMRRLQSGRNASQPSFQAIVNLGESNPVMGLLFNRVLRVPLYNPSFIPPVSQHYTFERINERYVKDGMALHKAIHSKHAGFRWPVADMAITRSMMAGNRMSEAPPSNETVVVVDMTGLDSGLSTIEQIRDQVSFLVSQYRVAAMMDNISDPNATVPADAVPSPFEVVVLLESPGGSAAEYGLAAQQLMRLRSEAGITLTICVDKVAASGGYMMACAASPGQLYAAPFAIVGSIGVIGQIINVQKLLEGWGLSPMVFRGGKDKVPLGAIGEVTEDGKAKTQALIDMTHRAFQDLVVSSRPILKPFMKKVGTGDIFLGKGALEVGLVDQILTSDEYISKKLIAGARVLKLVKNRKARFPFGSNFDNYDTTLEDRYSLSISTLISGAGRGVARLLGFGPQITSSNTFRHAALVAPNANSQLG
jgi:ATP-dependent protease ClpP protease subunit